MNEIKYFLTEAYKVAKQSPDPSTQNGAVIVDKNGYIISQGCNTFPELVLSTNERLISPLKYSFIEHAERSSILKAAKLGLCTKDTTMYCCWAACADCARAIICSGIKKLIVHEKMMAKTPERWIESINNAFLMLNEAKIEVVRFDEDLNLDFELLFNSEKWKP